MYRLKNISFLIYDFEFDSFPYNENPLSLEKKIDKNDQLNNRSENNQINFTFVFYSIRSYEIQVQIECVEECLHATVTILAGMRNIDCVTLRFIVYSI